MNSQRRTITLVFAGVLAVAAVLAAVLVVSSRNGGKSDKPAAPAARPALLRGIPQSGVTLGSPSAPTLAEFADLQCPYCGDFSRLVLPSVIREYVRTGKVKLVFRGLAFVGPDSTKALQAVFAAGQQNRLWDVLDGLYAAQGAENAGWVTDDLLKQVGGSVPGLDVEKMLGDMKSAAVTKDFAEASNEAVRLGVNSTPTFFLDDRRVEVSALTPAAFRQALDPLLAE